ncbi:MAG: GNAT family N-acetyltransferase [Candidatus Zixiibacteriota bacterium]
MLENLYLKGKGVIIRDLKRGDIDERLKWKPYPDPLYYHYNRPPLSKVEKELWYMRKREDPNLVYLSVDNLKGDLIGFLLLYKIDKKARASWMGIYLGYEYIDQGYGTDALQTMMKYYFEELDYEKLFLDVATLNKRAIRCYEKCGFKHLRTKFNLHDPRTQIDVFSNDRFKNVRKYFRKKGKDILVQFEEMVITREMWLNRKGCPNG